MRRTVRHKTLDIEQQTYRKTSDVIHQTWKHQKSNIGHQKYDIGHRTSDVRHQPVSDIRHESYSKTSAIGLKTLDIGQQTYSKTSDVIHQTWKHQKSDIGIQTYSETSTMIHQWCLMSYCMSDVRCLISDLQCLMSDGWCLTVWLMSDVWYWLMSYVWCPMPDVIFQTSDIRNMTSGIGQWNATYTISFPYGTWVKQTSKPSLNKQPYIT